ncbi:TlyA family rRNA (cytidine-2'-O)-methyltransferase [Sporolactobacillus putidus]|uniref:TlyA family rRNA (Cytidine-2'-O)-methyltransferase n=2 Tax=Sporolactobacillus putidus TaxID=492735 RepID=A0A917W1B5_9BACL|nr:TlyA family rRNA (cytidine-2'-O)-methyltransferase [Sporolactobacillus putidus]
MKDKERVDVLLVRKGLFDSREKAQRAVMAGMVYIGNQRVDKPGSKIDVEVSLNVKGDPMPYVGRGGFKLEKALKIFPITVSGKLMLDIGASTGGFTDCALQNGAAKVYALDVGYNQLAWKLRNDARVVVMEKTNFRYCTPADFSEGTPDFATIDVSFISLKKILPPLKNIVLQGSDIIALIKPQFEAGRNEVGKKGVVHDPNVHERVLSDLLQFAAQTGFSVLGLDYSPITGGDGNIEFLAHLNSDAGKAENKLAVPVQEVVERAHRAFSKSGQ